jgi:hypothetical protein
VYYKHPQYNKPNVNYIATMTTSKRKKAKGKGPTSSLAAAAEKEKDQNQLPMIPARKPKLLHRKNPQTTRKIDPRWCTNCKSQGCHQVAAKAAAFTTGRNNTQPAVQKWANHLQAERKSETSAWQINQETDAIKQEQLLATACKLLQSQYELPPRYRKMLPAYSKLTKKRTKNLETWVNTTKQTVHYLLNVRNQADDNPNDNTQLDTINQTSTSQPTNGLPTPSGSEASQVPPNTTA